jgi:hypothetical protein
VPAVLTRGWENSAQPDAVRNPATTRAPETDLLEYAGTVFKWFCDVERIDVLLPEAF